MEMTVCQLKIVSRYWVKVKKPGWFRGKGKVQRLDQQLNPLTKQASLP